MNNLSKKIAARKRDDRYFQYLNSFHEPLPRNPLRNARVSRDLTFQELADKVGLSKQTLIRAEQGLFEKPPEKLLKWLVDNGENELQLLLGYEEFQLLTRARHHRIFGDFTHFSYNKKEHPLEWLLNRWTAGSKMNVTECAKLLCLSQAQLSHWVRTPKQKHVPRPLLNALLQNGYAKWEIQVFSEMYVQYRKAVLFNDN